MPNRIIREGFVDSEAVNALTDWAHRVYSNLLVKCDDAGRFDGRLEYLRSHLFPLGTTRRTEDLRKAIEELKRHSLVLTYEHAQKPFIQITKWQRCGSAATSRYPWQDGGFEISYVTRQTRDGEKDFVSTSLDPPNSTPSTPPPDGVAIELNTETKTKTSTETKTETGGDLPPPLASDPDVVELWGLWKAHRKEKRSPLTPTAIRQQVKAMVQWGPEQSAAALRHSIANGYTGLFPPKSNQAKVNHAHARPGNHQQPARPLPRFGAAPRPN